MWLVATILARTRNDTESIDTSDEIIIWLEDPCND